MTWRPTKKQRAQIAAKLRGIKRSDETNNRHRHGHETAPRHVLTVTNQKPHRRSK